MEKFMMMKKIAVWALVLLSLLVFAACGGESVVSSAPTDADKPISADAAYDWGLVLTAEDVTSGGLTIVATQSGGMPTGELDTGSYYSLEVFSGGQWVVVEMLPQEYDVGWTSEAWIIPMNDSVEWSVDWQWLYGELPAGSYRIGKNVMEFRGSGDYDQCMFYAYFEIAE